MFLIGNSQYYPARVALIAAMVLLLQAIAASAAETNATADTANKFRHRDKTRIGELTRLQQASSETKNITDPLQFANNTSVKSIKKKTKVSPFNPRTSGNSDKLKMLKGKKSQTRLMRSADQAPNDRATHMGAQHDSQSGDAWTSDGRLLPTFTDQEQGDDMVALASDSMVPAVMEAPPERMQPSQAKGIPQSKPKQDMQWGYAREDIQESRFNSELHGDRFLPMANREEPPNLDRGEQNRPKTRARRPQSSMFSSDGDYIDDEDEEDEIQQQAGRGQASAVDVANGKNFDKQRDARSEQQQLGQRASQLSSQNVSTDIFSSARNQASEVQLQRMPNKSNGGWLPTSIGFDEREKTGAKAAVPLRPPVNLTRVSEKLGGIVGGAGRGDTLSTLARTDMAIEYLRSILKTKKQRSNSTNPSSKDSEGLGDDGQPSSDSQSFYPLPIRLDDQRQQNSLQQQLPNLNTSNYQSTNGQQMDGTLSDPEGNGQVAQQKSSAISESKFPSFDAKSTAAPGATAQDDHEKRSQPPPLAPVPSSTSSPTKSSPHVTSPPVVNFTAVDSPFSAAESVRTDYVDALPPVEGAGHSPPAVSFVFHSKYQPLQPSKSEHQAYAHELPIHTNIPGSPPQGTPLGGDYIDHLDDYPRASEPILVVSETNPAKESRQFGGFPGGIDSRAVRREVAAFNEQSTGHKQIELPPKIAQAEPRFTGSDSQSPSTLQQQQQQQQQQSVSSPIESQFFGVGGSPTQNNKAALQPHQQRQSEPSLTRFFRQQHHTQPEYKLSAPLNIAHSLQQVAEFPGHLQNSGQNRFDIDQPKANQARPGEYRKNNFTESAKDQQDQRDASKVSAQTIQQEAKLTFESPKTGLDRAQVKIRPQQLLHRPQQLHKQNPTHLISSKLYNDPERQTPLAAPMPPPQEAGAEVQLQQQPAYIREPPMPHGMAIPMPGQQQLAKMRPPKIVSYNYFEGPNSSSEFGADRSTSVNHTNGSQTADQIATNFQLGDSLLSSTGDIEHLLSQSELEAIQSQFMTAEHPTVALGEQPAQQQQHYQQDRPRHPNYRDAAGLSEALANIQREQASLNENEASLQRLPPHNAEEALKELASDEHSIGVKANPEQVASLRQLGAASNNPAELGKPAQEGAVEPRKKSLIVYLNHPSESELTGGQEAAAGTEYGMARLIREQTTGDPFVSAKEFDKHGLSKETKHLDVSNLSGLPVGLTQDKDNVPVSQDKDGLSVVVIGDAYKYNKIVLLISAKSGGLKFIPMVKDMK